MRSVWICCAFLSTLVPISDAISAIITPEYELFVSKGENISLHCTLQNWNSSMRSAEDILWYKDAVLLSSELSHALSANTSQLTVEDSTFDDSGNYGCGFPEDSYNDWEQIVVTVALPPSPVQNLTCKSYNVFDIHCTWREGAVETNTRNIHKAQFRNYGKSKLYEVTESTEYSCQFTINDNPKVFVRVTSTNSLGSDMVEVLFDSQKQVTPNQPERITAKPENSTNGNYVLSVEWEPPSEWPSFYALNYRVHYWSEISSEIEEKKIPGGFRWTLLEDLDPFTTYVIEVSAKIVSAEDLYWGEPGRTEATTLDGSPFGSVSGLRIASETNSITAGLRLVELQWQAPPRHEWGSEFISYAVHLIPQDYSPGHSLKEYKLNSSMPIILVHNVSKYQTYSVKITPYNNEGEGPETTFPEAISDRTSAPGKPTGLDVTLISDTLQIKWQPPREPNGILYVYEVVVIGDAVLSSNGTDVVGEAMLTTRTESQVIHVAVNCTELTQKGVPMEVKVAALTKNYTNYFFRGDFAHFTQDGVCKIKDEGPNVLFIGIFIPCSIIVSCIIALLLWNFFKDACVEPPEPHFSDKLIKPDRHVGIVHIPFSKEEVDKEQFDDLKTRESGDISIDIPRGQQTSNDYQNPRNLPKHGIERINSHDSGMPESPGSQCGDAMDFYNPGFVEDSVDVHHGPIQSISRNLSSGESDGVSSLWRQSGISNTSEDSGAEVMVKEDGIILDPSHTSYSTGDLPSPDPYFKVSALPPLSPQSRDFSSPYIKSPLGQDERMQKVEENGDEDEFDENDCPFEDDDSNSGYLKQYQLGSPTSLTSEVPPYMAMTPISPPPVSSCVPNGYVPAESLPCPVKSTTKGVLDQKGYVPEEYSTMVDSQAVTVEGYLKHDVIPTPKQISETPASYIKHTSLPSIDGNYLDNYPDFNHNVPPGPTLGPNQGPILGSKQESGDYVQHKDISTSSLSQEPAYIPNRSENSNSSEMPYSKLAVSDYNQY